ncbi:MAG TPA: hypothetical protein VEY67_01995 [Candidatus Dormibacteraeota bacterium]|nr:hypothetical protein [Candidatus Dormibacteraeota bacterium]
MIADADACVALHLGAATTAAALLGRVDGRWRLIGTLSMPSGIDPEVVVATLGARFRLADPALAAELGADVADWPRLVARAAGPPRMAVLAATDRTLERLERAARRAGWVVTGRSGHRADPLEMTRVLLERDVAAVLVGASDPPASDERPVIDELVALVAAAAERRPELTIVLSGAFGGLLDRFAGSHQAAEPVATSGPATPGPTVVTDIPRPDAIPTDAAAGHADRSLAGAADGSAGGDAEAQATGAPIADTAGSGGAPARSEGGGVVPGGVDPAEPAVAEAAKAVGPVEAARVAGRAVGRARPGSLIVAPAPAAGSGSDEPLRRLLDDLRSGPDDAWRGVVRSTESLASTLRRRIETIAIGQTAGLRAIAAPLGATGAAEVVWSLAPEAALVPDVDEALVDRILRWATTTSDRYRMRDRLAELRLAPWGEAHGDGAPLRLAAARAAMERLVAMTPELARPIPDLVLATGGVWSAAPGPAVALALADVVRRPGASQLALDHARLLGPLGTLLDADERSAILADLADDLLAPLGSLVVPSGLHAGRSAGRLIVHAATGTTELDLVPGGLELVDLPPGESALAEFRFVDPVVIGTRGRRFEVDVSGGLGGLLVDLRDVPLRLPDRPDRRRELLGAWQRALWVGLDA